MTPTLVQNELFETQVCEICNQPLDDDNVYGPEGFDLCRFHHEKFYELVQLMLTGELPKQEGEV